MNPSFGVNKWKCMIPEGYTHLVTGLREDGTPNPDPQFGTPMTKQQLDSIESGAYGQFWYGECATKLVYPPRPFFREIVKREARYGDEYYVGAHKPDAKWCGDQCYAHSSSWRGFLFASSINAGASDNCVCESAGGYNAMTGCYITGSKYYAIYSHLQCPYVGENIDDTYNRGYFETDTLCRL